eukprot:CAMPEP_0198117546 /NCGR_PEP_ID=MMETSP1442-20131203/18520_1 /TAXON_ID= /ORGANISM="Craspedostauros australis, Strain CCMP3328" /LENGTH=177 /DNA_ID=CAMNT_0043775617 /DNA_START=122 /DNA_END=655 /DNA_ORIENTATION=+
MADLSNYKVGVVLSVEESTSKKGGKALRTCKVQVSEDGDAEPLLIVTSAPNVRDGSRVCVAPVGSTVVNDEGDEITIQKTSVGGQMSEGMLCDSKMLGWTGGAAGIAVQMPEHLPIGSTPPASKPRPQDSNASEEVAAAAGPGLFEKKLTKEEKKKLAAERKAARKAKKEAAAAAKE